MQRIVGHPGGEDVAGTKWSELRMRTRFRPVRVCDAAEPFDGPAPLGDEALQRCGEIAFVVAAADGPGFGIDRGPRLGRIAQRQFDAGSEVFDLLIRKMGHDLKDRPRTVGGLPARIVR